MFTIIIIIIIIITAPKCNYVQMLYLDRKTCTNVHPDGKTCAMPCNGIYQHGK